MSIRSTIPWATVFSKTQNALLIELEKNGLKAVKETPIQVSYDGRIIGKYIADILVEDLIILELKSVKELHPAHEAQVINYLKATNREVGLLINFGERVDIRRKVLTPPPADASPQEIACPIS